MIFQLGAHVRKLFNSCKVYGMTIPFTPTDTSTAIKQTILENKINECYVRPIVFYDWDEVGVNPHGNQIHMAIAVWPWFGVMTTRTRNGSSRLLRKIFTQRRSFSKTLAWPLDGFARQRLLLL